MCNLRHTDKTTVILLNLFNYTYMNLWVELDQETFSLKAQFTNLGPIEGIYFCVTLGEQKKKERRILSNNEGYVHRGKLI